MAARVRLARPLRLFSGSRVLTAGPTAGPGAEDPITAPPASGDAGDSSTADTVYLQQVMSTMANGVLFTQACASLVIVPLFHVCYTSGVAGIVGPLCAVGAVAAGQRINRALGPGSPTGMAQRLAFYGNQAKWAVPVWAGSEALAAVSTLQEGATLSITAANLGLAVGLYHFGYFVHGRPSAQVMAQQWRLPLYTFTWGWVFSHANCALQAALMWGQNDDPLSTLFQWDELMTCYVGVLGLGVALTDPRRHNNLAIVLGKFHAGQASLYRDARQMWWRAQVPPKGPTPQS